MPCTEDKMVPYHSMDQLDLSSIQICPQTWLNSRAFLNEALQQLKPSTRGTTRKNNYFCMIREIMTIMIIQRGCSDVTRAEDGKLHSHLEWPYISPFTVDAAILYSNLASILTQGYSEHRENLASCHQIYLT